MEALIIIAVAIVVLAIDAYLAVIFRDVAAEKGFYEARYFWVPFLFGIVGYILVAALPDRKAAAAAQKPGRPLANFTQPTYSAPNGAWVCMTCGTQNPFDVIRCRCGAPRNEQ